jgi:hypothetical protein
VGAASRFMRHARPQRSHKSLCDTKGLFVVGVIQRQRIRVIRLPAARAPRDSASRSLSFSEWMSRLRRSRTPAHLTTCVAGTVPHPPGAQARDACAAAGDTPAFQQFGSCEPPGGLRRNVRVSSYSKVRHRRRVFILRLALQLLDAGNGSTSYEGSCSSSSPRKNSDDGRKIAGNGRTSAWQRKRERW